MKKRILIVRIDRIGDVVLTTAIPREIKKQFPDSYIAVLVRSYTQDIFKENPYIDDIINADSMLQGSISDAIKSANEIRKYNFTHSFMILPNERISYILFLAGIKHKFGTGYKFYQFITGTTGISRNKYIPLRHEADYCMDFARKIGIRTDNIYPEIYLSNIEKELVKEKRAILTSGENSKYIIGIHSSSGNSAPNWKPEIFKLLILQLVKRNDFIVVVTDNNVPSDLDNITGVSYINKNLSLRESIINFAKLDCLISASTGPLHIAVALKVITVSLFCPLTACSPKLWGPIGNKNEVILPSENYCKNFCPNDPKKCNYKGGEDLMLYSVLNSIDKVLKK